MKNRRPIAGSLVVGILGMFASILITGSVWCAVFTLPQNGASYLGFSGSGFTGTGQFLSMFGNNMGGGSSSGSGGGGGGMALRIGPMLAMGTPQSITDGALIFAALNPSGPNIKDQNWFIWADGYDINGDRDGTAAGSIYEYSIYGSCIGIEHRFSENVLIGIGGGYSFTDLSFKQLQFWGEVTGYQAALYGSFRHGSWYLNGIGAYGWNDYQSMRIIGVPFLVSQTALGDYDGYSVSGYLESGYTFKADGFRIGPLAALRFIYLSQDGFTETGAGVNNITVPERDSSSMVSFLGIRSSVIAPVSDFLKIMPSVHASWAHEFKDNPETITTQYSAIPAATFLVTGDKPEDDYAVINAGLTFILWNRLHLYGSYDCTLRSDHDTHGISGGIRVAW